MILGRAGAGKTILTSRFALTLLANRNTATDRPVPVIFTLGSWDATVSSLRDWLAEQLINTYPVLAERDSTGTTVAEQLLATGRILPVLDGFDEIPEGLRADAIIGINAALRTGDRLLLTSRPGEYEAAVEAGDVLTAAAIVRLSDLASDDVRSYLPLTTRKTRSGTATKWDPVLDHTYQSPGFSALAAVLSTPLMVALARAIFSDTDADPTDLLKCTSAAEMEDRLLEGFVPAVYSRLRHDNLPCSAENAQRYFGFLAAHLQRLGTYDLAWWELVTAIPRIAIGLVSGFVITLVVWLGAGMLLLLGTWTDDVRTAWLAASTVAAVACGVVGGIIIGLGLRLRYPSPAKIQLQAATRLSRFSQDIAFEWRSGRVVLWFLVWLFAGAIFGFAAMRILDSKNGLVVGLVVGFLAGFGINLVTTIVRVLTVPVEPTETITRLLHFW